MTKREAYRRIREMKSLALHIIEYLADADKDLRRNRIDLADYNMGCACSASLDLEREFGLFGRSLADELEEGVKE